MNPQQKKRFDKIWDEPLFLLKKDIVDKNIVFTISGSTANIYTVTIYNYYKNINCDCPDAKSYARRYGCICKHSCFVIFKVLKMITPQQFFKKQNYKFTEQDIQLIYSRLKIISYNDTTICNQDFIKKFQQLQINQNQNQRQKQFQPSNPINSFNNDSCIICFDEFDPKIPVVECPKCHNLLHAHCIKKWLTMGNRTCVYCRSNVWSQYLENKNNYQSLH